VTTRSVGAINQRTAARTDVNILMNDLPAVVLSATIWVYWTCVGVMSVRVRRRTRRLAGIVPSQALEQVMWLIWVPLVAAWMTLPYLAATRTAASWALPAFAHEMPYMALRWLAAGFGIVCLALSIECWRRMGKNWRMAVAPDQKTELVTTGLYRYVRHPIYAVSIVLMLCTVVVVPTGPVVVMAALHITLMIMKARNEERFLLGVHGAAYEQYCRQAGRFFPRLGSATSAPNEAQ
jgi:protein-S-isoprenylcysteine O-methyltransferase Ste14